MRMIHLLFKYLIAQGDLTVTDHHGTPVRVGDGSGPPVAVRFTTAHAERQVLFAPHYHLLETYTNGTLVMENGTYYQFLDMCVRNQDSSRGLRFLEKLHGAIGKIFLAWESYNPAKLAQRRISHHYDLSENLFRLFLDEDMQYSCAYFTSPDASLEAAQIAKKRHIAAKLNLKPGQRVLDIGCGWGGMALSLAKAAEVEVLGITLSKEQLQVARQRAAQAGLDKRVHFELMDYRRLTGTFDRIVSVGMFEHVGPPSYRTYFNKVRDLLTPDGVALVHSVGQFDSGGCNPWVRHRIFPGAYVPTLSQSLRAVEQAQLLTTDVEILRIHYADTLRAWYERFQKHRDEIRALYDERFCRMWGAYLNSCEVGFRHMSLMVFQVQMTRDRHALPLTRDYIVDRERAWIAREGNAPKVGVVPKPDPGMGIRMSHGR